MIKITTKSGVTRTFPDDKLAAICLELAGGGYTAAQTAKAMQYQDALTKEGTLKVRTMTITITKETTECTKS